jgi:hypothetical protein
MEIIHQQLSVYLHPGLLSSTDPYPQQLSGDALIAQKRAEIAAKVAAMKGGIAGLGKVTPPVKADSPSPAPGTPLQNVDDLSRKVAEAKRRVAEAQTKLAVKDNPYMVSSIALRTFACILTMPSVGAPDGQEEQAG